MTRAEAIEILKNLVGYESGCAIGAEGFRLELYRYRVEALEIAIEALKAEPKLQQALEQEKGAYNALVANVHCNDCISRQAAIYAINHAGVNFNVKSKFDLSVLSKEIREIVCHIAEAQEKALNDLPLVTPQQRTGRWIKTYDNSDAEPFINGGGRMTREEAAEKLKSLWYFLTNNDYPQKDLDALKVAIKALEQENILDKIRAEIDQYLFQNEFGSAYREEVSQIIEKYRSESEVEE